MKRIFAPLTALALLVVPVVTHAQLGNVENIVESLGNIIDLATPIVVGLALLAFFWGLAKYIFNAGNEEAKDEGKRIMIWGIIALFVMVSIWGIVEFIGGALDIEQGGNIPIPSI